MSRHLLFPIALTLAAGATAATIDVPPTSPSVRILARSLDTNPQELQWAWSGSGAMVAFEGTSCAVRMTARGAIYRVRVDGKESALDLSGSSDTLHTLASGLAPGYHVVELRAKTEAHTATTRFRGFRIDGKAAALPGPSARRIEFYGNSITCGYGILDSVATNGFSVKTEDEGLTFAALAADSLGAERRVVCWSGKGVLKNYGSDTLTPTLPKLHRQILPSDAKNLWDVARWVPHVVVVDLGTNDFSGIAPDSARFHRAYLGFLDSLHAHYPDARIVLVDGPMLSDGYPAGMNALTRVRRHLDNLVAAATAKGMSASHLELTPQGDLGFGADYHPNRAQARLNGQELTAHIRRITGWVGTATAADAPSRATAARLVRIEGGWGVASTSDHPLQARILDAAGASVGTAHIAPQATTALPPSSRPSWIRIDSPEGPHVVSIPPALR